MKVDYDARRFKAAMLALSRMRGADSLQNVLINQASKTLEIAAKKVPAAKVVDIKDRARWEAQKRKIPVRVAEIKGKRSRGLAKQAFYTASKQLNKPAKVPAYVRKARPQDDKIYKSAEAGLKTKGFQKYVEVKLFQPILFDQGGQRALDAAINARANAIFNDIRRGVFNDIETMLKRYPGVFVKR